MTKDEIQQIESHIGFPLPSCYRETLLTDPFKSDSFANEFMLPNDPQAVIELNDGAISIDSCHRALFIGSDGGEERYFIDASQEESAVFVFELETGKQRMLSPTWSGYLAHIHAALAELEADEQAELERRKKKKWWHFW